MLLAGGCATKAGPVPYAGAERDVWSTAIRYLDAPGEVVVVRGVTRSEVEHRTYDGFPDALVDQMRAAPERPLRGALDLGRRVVLVPPGDLDAMWSATGSTDEGWRAFRERYPHAEGFVSLSRVAFSAGGVWAVVSVSRSYGSRGGNGTLLLLRRTRGGWRVERATPLWIA